MPKIYGTLLDDKLSGGNGDDFIYGGPLGSNQNRENGSDTLSGGTGADHLYGGGGPDILYGQGGDDVLIGGDGNDVLDDGWESIGIDRLDGGAGDDRLISINGVDTLDGGSGLDRATIIRSSATKALAFTLAKGASPTTLVGDGTKVVHVEAFTLGGGAGNDRFTVGEGDDSLGGGDGDDVLNGGAGNDTLSGGLGKDTLNGGAGQDTLYADGGLDLLDGGDGLDRAVIDRSFVTTGLTFDQKSGASVTTLVGDGTRIVNVEAIDFKGGSGHDRVTVRGSGSNSLSGNAGDDVLTGGTGTDVVYGGSGRDVLNGSGGNDFLDDGGVFGPDITERDRLDGGEGNDTLTSNGGADSLDGGAGFDTAVINRAMKTTALTFLVTGTGRATTLVGDGVSVIHVEAFTLRGGSGADRFTTGAGNDALGGGDGNDALDGGAGDDLLQDGPVYPDYAYIPGGTSKDRDTLFGGAGDDTLISAGGSDTLNGGTGLDKAQIDRAALKGTLTFIMTNPATKTTLVGDGTTVVNVEAIDLRSGSGNDHLTTGSGDDRLYGGAGNDVLDGGGGDDRLIDGDYAGTAREGTDSLKGGAGDDRLTSLGGIDTLNGGSGQDWAYIDRTSASAALTFTMKSSKGATTLVGDGTKVIDVESVEIHTGSGKDHLTAGAGNDTLDGGAGNDVLDGGGGVDTVSFTSSWQYFAGIRIDLAFGKATGGGYTDTLKNFENATGSGLDDVLIGNRGDNVLNGNKGSDILSGGGGNDTASYAFQFSATSLKANLTTGKTVVLYDSGKDVDTLISIENLTGSSTGDTLIGNAGANRLDGGAGDDILDGYGGGDLLTGGLGKDTFVFSTALGAGNVDRIADFSSTDDTLRLSPSAFPRLGTGPLAESAFKDVASGKLDADDRILYDHRSGALSYDADGAGKGAAVVFAILDDKPATLTFADFLVVA